MSKLTKTEKILSFLQSYVYPTIVIIIMMVMGWATLSNTVYANRDNIAELQSQCEYNEKVINLILQRLSSIDTKLDFIIEDINN